MIINRAKYSRHVFTSLEPVEYEESKDSCVRGYHIYQEIWHPVVGEELECIREVTNVVDRYAVAVIKNAQVVGHLPKKISRICTLFIRRGGTIICRVTGRRRRSLDLVQGGLEVPCQLIFRSQKKKEIEKLSHLTQ